MTFMIFYLFVLSDTVPDAMGVRFSNVIKDMRIIESLRNNENLNRKEVMKREIEHNATEQNATENNVKTFKYFHHPLEWLTMSHVYNQGDNKDTDEQPHLQPLEWLTVPHYNNQGSSETEVSYIPDLGKIILTLGALGEVQKNLIFGPLKIFKDNLGYAANGVKGERLESSMILTNPEEMGGYAEGDIVIPALGMNKTARWDKGIIPYIIEGYYNEKQSNLIMQAMADYHRQTCLRFVPYTGERDYLVIRSNGTGCWSSIGKLGGRQELNLQSPGCVAKKGTILHELLHAVGFMHEQSRPERDDYVDIIYSNIIPGAEVNFRKANPMTVDNYSVPYDYNSIMHYSEYAFSKNNKRTIIPKIGGVKLGQRLGLSFGDLRKVNNMYNCNKWNK